MHCQKTLEDDSLKIERCETPENMRRSEETRISREDCRTTLKQTLTNSKIPDNTTELPLRAAEIDHDFSAGFTAINHGGYSLPINAERKNGHWHRNSRRERTVITESYDVDSPAKINVQINENAIKADAVIQTFSHVIEKYVTLNYECEKIGELYMAHGMSPVYCLTHHAKKYGFYRTWVGAPACAATVEEIRMILNTDKIIHFGGAGCLNKEIARGKVMIPTDRKSVV